VRTETGRRWRRTDRPTWRSPLTSRSYGTTLCLHR
jgi:hypothetical protein